ncbi:hypothetical protein FE810_05080 [Thalassotalea litorea]|uniref:GlsB/YeaQ/YmgE family stress response membrane protein n=1 Tax=Thalassotalea litorea TaxID=2020715 RepID=A0A5R9IMW6_9GAMM|nr:hypothetical protein [Thalassotalea litorea]TLU66880.1 hypothetical protein FE810_05080 [Thalassotalea litorea]
MDEYLPLIIQMGAGAVGGNVAGTFLQGLSFGFLGNSLVGIVGGGMTSKVLYAFNVTLTGNSMDYHSVVSDLISGCIGGGLLMLVIAFVRSLFGN